MATNRRRAWMLAAQSSCTWLLLVVLVGLPRLAFASLGGEFFLKRAAWTASDIVLAKTTSEGGVFQVVERWKGDLSVPSRIAISELAPASGAVPISSYPKRLEQGSRVSEQIPKQPVGSLVILFLTRKKQIAGSADGKEIEWSGWEQDTHPESMRDSVVWVEGEKLYCFQKDQTSLPPAVLSVLMDWGKPDSCCAAMTTADLKLVVDEESQVQQEEEAAIAITDGGKRALHLKSFVKSPLVFASNLALHELGKAGPKAVKTIEDMLDDPLYSDQASELVRALATAGGKAVANELNLRLQKDVAFWSSVAPTLKANWWNNDTAAGSLTKNHYGQTLMLVYELKALGDAKARSTALALRSVWLTLPPLGADDHHMIDECDELISTS